MKPYCISRQKTIRHKTREVSVGNIKIGGDHRISVQSMTTTKTEDVAATVKQARELAEAGCDIVRVTAPTLKAARALKDIRKQLLNDGIETPLVADIHFLPKAAMEAVEHVEKVRINPGNYADYKKFKTIDYTDAAYEEQIERIHEAVTPFILRCKELGRAIRIGTNHGSLSDRIMNRYGDTPEGMVESALEFIRIAESHNFHNIVLSMKASNPKVMISAYRLTVARMKEENMAYPLHLGVTEAGDGEDARIKSYAGIGALLADGLGDTLRVSLTEDPVHEVPVGQDLVKWTEKLWQQSANLEESTNVTSPEEQTDFYHPQKSRIELPSIEKGAMVWNESILPIVAVGTPKTQDIQETLRQISNVQLKQKSAQIEYWVQPVTSNKDVETLKALAETCSNVIKGFVVDLCNTDIEAGTLDWQWMAQQDYVWVVNATIDQWKHLQPCIELSDKIIPCYDFGGISSDQLQSLPSLPDRAFVTLSQPLKNLTSIGSYRTLIATLQSNGKSLALWLRNGPSHFVDAETSGFAHLMMESSVLSGTLLCEGHGNMISIESETDLGKASALGYNILQAAKARISKTEYVACPSCGRTLFDLQTTTQAIRSRTDHLKGVTIAIMGCIVNGPGEMADADFGYVGGAPGKVNLYVGKTCVKNGIPETEAVDALIQLIKDHNRWQEKPND